MMVIYVTALALLLLAVAFATLFVRQFSRTTGRSPADSNRPNEFSVEKYRPFERLFDSADLEFVSRQPGYTAALGRKLASSRRSVARLYLSELTADFDRLVRQGREAVAASPVDRPDLVSILLRQWLTFHLRVLSLRMQLRLAPLGLAFPGPSVLLEQFGRMRSLLVVVGATGEA